MTVVFHPIRDDFGAEVSGVDLRHRLRDRVFETILDGFHRYGLLVFRGQELDPADEVALARRFPNDGGLPPYKTYLLHGYPEITLLGNVDPPDGHSRAYLNQIGIEWHTDGTSHPRPMIATLLYAVDAPRQGGETLFASGYAAWEVQPHEVKSRIEGLRVRYDFGQLLEKQSAANGVPVEKLWKKWRDRTGPIEHPLVLTHPVTGRNALWVSWAEMERIVGLDEEESLALVMELLDHATTPDRVYVHRWQPHDLVVLDNRCILHSTTPYTYAGERRLMHRIGLCGDKSFS